LSRRLFQPAGVDVAPQTPFNPPPAREYGGRGPALAVASRRRILGRQSEESFMRTYIKNRVAEARAHLSPVLRELGLGARE
jgi:hypothetical protein